MLRARWALLWALLLSFLVASLQAAEPWRSPDSDTSLAHFPSKLVDDLPHLFTPDNGVCLAAGGFLTAADWALLDGNDGLAKSLKNMKAQPLFDFGNFYGEGWVEGFGALGSWSIGALAKDERMQEFGRDAAESLVDSTLLVTGLKYAVGRERPDGSNNQSFPSGHAITAFCVCPVVTKYFGLEAGIPAYALATVTALARVEGQHHYLSDVLGGATLGVLIGNAVAYQPKDFSLSAGMGSLQLAYRF